MQKVSKFKRTIHFLMCMHDFVKRDILDIITANIWIIVPIQIINKRYHFTTIKKVRMNYGLWYFKYTTVYRLHKNYFIWQKKTETSTQLHKSFHNNAMLTLIETNATAYVVV